MQPQQSVGGTPEYHFARNLLLDLERLLGLIAASLLLAQLHACRARISFATFSQESRALPKDHAG